MKTTLTKSGLWPVACDRKNIPSHEVESCPLSPLPCHTCGAGAERRRAFTIVELLTVIAIIAILAALLLPVLAAAKVHAQKTQAQLQANDLVNAIQKYNSDYSRMPISPAAQALAMQSQNSGMFTYGSATWGAWTPATITAFYPSNNEVIAILTDTTNITVTAVNANNQKNPQGTIYLSAKMVSTTNAPGIGPDLVYRDPWKNPYVITMDLNDDNQCKDPFYSLSAVSGPGGNTSAGLNGLSDPDGTADNFRFHGNVMVWSAGPDGKIDPTQAANQGFNKDNIVSWQ